MLKSYNPLIPSTESKKCLALSFSRIKPHLMYYPLSPASVLHHFPSPPKTSLSFPCCTFTYTVSFDKNPHFPSYSLSFKIPSRFLHLQKVFPHQALSLLIYFAFRVSTVQLTEQYWCNKSCITSVKAIIPTTILFSNRMVHMFSPIHLKFLMAYLCTLMPTKS